MKKLLALSILPALAGAGCFGSDPNQNSMLAPLPDGSTATGNGGASGNPTGPILGNPLATFDKNSSGFVLNAYADMNQVDLNDPAKIASLMEMPTISWDGTDGSPSAGSLQIVAPYSGASQYVDLRSPDFPKTGLQNWSGGTLHVRIKVISGTFGGGVQMYVDTGTTYSFGGTYTNWGKGSDWQEFTLNINSPMSFGDQTTYDPKQVITYGMQLNTGSAGTSAKPVTFLIDSFSIAGIAPPATGNGGAGGGSASDGGGAAGAGGGAAAGAGGHADAAVD